MDVSRSLEDSSAKAKTHPKWNKSYTPEQSQESKTVISKTVAKTETLDLDNARAQARGSEDSKLRYLSLRSFRGSKGHL